MSGTFPTRVSAHPGRYLAKPSFGHLPLAVPILRRGEGNTTSRLPSRPSLTGKPGLGEQAHLLCRGERVSLSTLTPHSWSYVGTCDQPRHEGRKKKRASKVAAQHPKAQKPSKRCSRDNIQHVHCLPRTSRPKRQGSGCTISFASVTDASIRRNCQRGSPPWQAWLGQVRNSEGRGDDKSPVIARH